MNEVLSSIGILVGVGVVTYLVEVASRTWGRLPTFTDFEVILAELQLTRTGKWRPDVLEGTTSDGHGVRVVARTYRGEEEYQHETRIEVTAARGSLPKGLVIRRAQWRRRVAARGGRVVIGEQLFDRQVHLEGDEALLLAALPGHERRRLQENVNVVGLSLEGGVLQFGETMGELAPAAIVSRVRELLSLARALSMPPEEVATRLAANVARDRSAIVRRRSLELLLERFPASAAAGEAVRAALKDKSPEARLVAARACRTEEALPVLHALVLETGEGGRAAEALELLAARFPAEAIRTAISAALASPRSDLRVAAVKAIGRVKAVRYGKAVAALAVISADESLAIECAKALHALGDAQAEPALLRLLAHPSGEVRREAVDALATLGTVASVEPLQSLAAGFLTGALGTRARDAARRIQERLMGEVGQLSLVAASELEGGLSHAAAEGELAIAEEEPEVRPQPKTRA